MSVARNLKERKALESKWKSGEGLVRTVIQPDASIMKDLGLEYLDKPVESKLVCSFCGVEVYESTATRGTSRVKGKIKLVNVPDDPRDEYEEKVVVYNEKVVACPEHCLLVKPIMRKIKDADGNVIGEEMVNQGVRLPLGD